MITFRDMLAYELKDKKLRDSLLLCTYSRATVLGSDLGPITYPAIFFPINNTM